MKNVLTSLTPMVLLLAPLSCSSTHIQEVAGSRSLLPCPGWAGDSCSWNMTASPRASLEASSCSLVLEPVLLEDAGLHSCSTGQVELEGVVEPGVPSIAEGRQGGRLWVEAGGQVVLRCESQGGRPLRRYGGRRREEGR